MKLFICPTWPSRDLLEQWARHSSLDSWGQIRKRLGLSYRFLHEYIISSHQYLQRGLCCASLRVTCTDTAVLLGWEEWPWEVRGTDTFFWHYNSIGLSILSWLRTVLPEFLQKRYKIKNSNSEFTEMFIALKLLGLQMKAAVLIMKR